MSSNDNGTSVFIQYRFAAVVRQGTTIAVGEVCVDSLLHFCGGGIFKLVGLARDGRLLSGRAKPLGLGVVLVKKLFLSKYSY